MESVYVTRLKFASGLIVYDFYVYDKLRRVYKKTRLTMNLELRKRVTLKWIEERNYLSCISSNSYVTLDTLFSYIQSSTSVSTWYSLGYEGNYKNWLL